MENDITLRQVIDLLNKHDSAGDFCNFCGVSGSKSRITHSSGVGVCGDCLDRPIEDLLRNMGVQHGKNPIGP